MVRSSRKSNRRPFHQNDANVAAAPRFEPAASPNESVECTTPSVSLPVATVSRPEAADPVSQRLDFIVELMTKLDARLVHLAQPHAASDMPQSEGADDPAESELLRCQLEQLIRDNQELRQQNHDLAAQLAHSSVRQSVRQSDGVDESLSWEQRKAMIFDQMESDSFDAEAFIGQLSSAGARGTSDETSPQQFVEDLIEKHRRAEHLATRRAEEVEELRMLLHQQAEDRQSGVVIGAAAVAGMIDSDELVQQERARLQELKTQWEEKIRETEIAASLERAKLSRERQDLARRASELEAQLETLQRQQKERAEPAVPGGRRWLAELGLGARS